MPATIYCRVCKTTTALSNDSDRRAYELEALAEEHLHGEAGAGAAPPVVGPRAPTTRLYGALFAALRRQSGGASS